MVVAVTSKAVVAVTSKAVVAVTSKAVIAAKAIIAAKAVIAAACRVVVVEAERKGTWGGAAGYRISGESAGRRV